MTDRFFDILMEVKVFDKKEWSAQTKLEPIVFHPPGIISEKGKQ
jgi:hypothetical protein